MSWAEITLIVSSFGLAYAVGFGFGLTVRMIKRFLEGIIS